VHRKAVDIFQAPLLTEKLVRGFQGSYSTRIPGDEYSCSCQV
jgi:hypothetical protein